MRQMTRIICLAALLVAGISADPTAEELARDYVPIEGKAKSLLDFSKIHLEAKAEDQSEDDPKILERLSQLDAPAAEKRLGDAVERIIDELLKEPVEIEEIGPFNLKNEEFPAFDLDLMLRSIKIQGLDELRIENFSFSVLTQRFTLRVVLPQFRLTGKFEGRGEVAKIISLVRNGGSIRIIGDDIALDIAGRLRLSIFGATTLREYRSDLSIGHTFIYIDGLISNGYINFAANWMLQRTSYFIINHRLNWINGVVSNATMAILNRIAEQFNIFDIIFGGGD